MKNGAAGKKKSRNSHFPKALPWFNHGSTRRGKNAGEKIESALIWGRHLQKGLVKSVGFFFPSRFLCFFFFFENQFLEKLVFKTSFFNHPNTLYFSGPYFFKRRYMFCKTMDSCEGRLFVMYEARQDAINYTQHKRKRGEVPP